MTSAPSASRTLRLMPGPGIGDVDGDGTIDLLITSAWSRIHGFHSGRMFVISSGVIRSALNPRQPAAGSP